MQANILSKFESSNKFLPLKKMFISPNLKLKFISKEQNCAQNSNDDVPSLARLFLHFQNVTYVLSWAVLPERLVPNFHLCRHIRINLAHEKQDKISDTWSLPLDTRQMTSSPTQFTPSSPTPSDLKSRKVRPDMPERVTLLIFS